MKKEKVYWVDDWGPCVVSGVTVVNETFAEQPATDTGGIQGSLNV